MRISDWSSDVCSSDLRELRAAVIVNVDARYNRHAGGEIQLGRWQRIEYQLYRHSLYNLDVVAAGILRGQQAERRTGACLHTVDTCGEFVVRIGIDPDADRLTDAHVAPLGFLEVGDDQIGRAKCRGRGVQYV